MLEPNITLRSVKPLQNGECLITLSNGDEFLRSERTLREEYNDPAHHKAMADAVEHVRKGQAFTAAKPKAKAKAKPKS